MLYHFDNETDWLAARAKDVTSTEIAALFGLHPYKSRLQLWHEKAGYLEPEFVESNFSKWGRRLQIPVGRGICEDEGWQGFDLTGYYYSVSGLGASMDFRVECGQRGTGFLETKVAESFDERHGWTETRAPLHYEFQLQTQAHCAHRSGHEVDFVVLGTLGRRQNTRLYFREYDPELGEMIDAEVKAFWESVAQDNPPAPDYVVDAPTLERLRGVIRTGKIADLSLNNRARDLAFSYKILQSERAAVNADLKRIDQQVEAVRCELLEYMGDAETARIGEYTVNAREVVVEGRYQYGYTKRLFNISERKSNV